MSLSLMIKRTYLGFLPSPTLTLLTGGLRQQKQTRHHAFGMQPAASTSGWKESAGPPQRREHKEQDEGRGSVERMHFPGAEQTVDAKVSLRQSPSKYQMGRLQKMLRPFLNSEKTYKRGTTTTSCVSLFQ